MQVYLKAYDSQRTARAWPAGGGGILISVKAFARSSGCSRRGSEHRVGAARSSSSACSPTVSAAGGSPPSPTEVPDPVCQGVFAAPLCSAAARAGPQSFCRAAASGDRGGLSLAPGACELTAGETTSGTVSASDHRGGRQPSEPHSELACPSILAVVSQWRSPLFQSRAVLIHCPAGQEAP